MVRPRLGLIYTIECGWHGREPSPMTPRWRQPRTGNRSPSTPTRAPWARAPRGCRSCRPTSRAAHPTARTARRSASGRCNPPAQEPGQLTVGTPDANGQGAKSVGHLRIDRAWPVTPPRPADEADVRRAGNDHRRAPGAQTSPTTPATLEARLSMQITDKDNTPHPGGPGAATVQELTQSLPDPVRGRPPTRRSAPPASSTPPSRRWCRAR